MSCEKNRGQFLAHVAAAGSPAAELAGDTPTAVRTLETIFDQARRVAPLSDQAQCLVAAQKTRLLFDQMRRAGLQPPTHSKTGLPRKDAQFGYARLYETLQALDTRGPLPASAQHAFAQIGSAEERVLRAVRADAGVGRMRCASCGQFAPSDGSSRPAHICPNTTSPAKLLGALQRRLRVPATAYPEQELAALLHAAQTGPIAMRHAVTGEPVAATLDSLPLALSQGFLPDCWNPGDVELVEVEHRRIVPVLNALGLARVAPPTTAIGAAAVASGGHLPAGTTMVSPITPTPILQVTTLSPGGTPPVTVAGGTLYDTGRFKGTEFRKEHGTAIYAIDGPFTVGDRLMDKQYWASARKNGDAKPPPTKGAYAGIAVGRTLVAAAEILRTGSVIHRPDGVTEVYRVDGSLAAVYDATNRIAGDLAGNTNASPEQMAAIMADMEENPHTALQKAMARDMAELRAGMSTSVAAADGAYLAIMEDLDFKPFMLGGSVAAARCPECGQFMSSSGCQAIHPPSVAAAPAPAVPTTPAAPAVVVESPPPPPTSAVVVESPPPPPTSAGEAVAPATSGDSNSNAVMITAQFVRTMDRLADVLRGSDPRRFVVDGADQLRSGITISDAPLAPRADRPVPTDMTSATPQERLVAGGLVLPRPDRTLGSLPDHLLPPGFRAIDESIPAIDPGYQLDDRETLILRQITAARAAGVAMKRVNNTRTFGIYGPPGTGKNKLIEQFAASMVTQAADGTVRQGVHLEQVEFDRDMDINALIGAVTIEGGSTKARLGPIGQAAVMGGVIALNEVVRNPKALTMFQSMMEEGEIRLKTPEGGIVSIPIHPATTFVLTWNPGLEGDADRPAEAPRSRLTASFELPQPTVPQRIRRVMAYFKDAPSHLVPQQKEVRAAINYLDQVATAITQRKLQVGTRGTKAMPTPRDMVNFMLAYKTGGAEAALAQMTIFADSNGEHRQRDLDFLEQTFKINFGGSVTP